MKNELTAEEMVLLNEYYDEGVKIIYCTDDADRKTAEATITNIYRKEKHEPPTFVWVDSPKQAKEMILKLKGEWFLTDLWGQHDIYWIQHYRFAEAIGAKYAPEDSDYLNNTWYPLAKSAMWWWPFDTHCIICNRPKEIHVDDSAELHNETGPAMSFRDGLELYVINGNEVPKFVVMEPETITLKHIEDTENAEVRRIMIMRMGADKYLKAIGAKLINRDRVKVGEDVVDDEGNPYYIVRGLFHDKYDNAWLVGHDGSTKRMYFMSVSPKAKTCAEAHFSISGFKDDDIVASG